MQGGGLINNKFAHTVLRLISPHHWRLASPTLAALASILRVGCSGGEGGSLHSNRRRGGSLGRAAGLGEEGFPFALGTSVQSAGGHRRFLAI